jgi:hypothetical protein
MHRADPYGQPPLQPRPPQAAPVSFGGDFGSDDILAALSQLQGLMPAAPALPASSVDVDYNDIFNMMLKKD